MIPVVDQQRLIGIVTMQNLMHSMSLLAESRRLRKQQQRVRIAVRPNSTSIEQFSLVYQPSTRSIRLVPHRLAERWGAMRQ